jgi:ribosomal protein L29
MANTEPMLEQLREELARLRDDLAVIECGDIFSISSTGGQEPVDEQAVNVIRRRIAEIESILERDHE